MRRSTLLLLIIIFLSIHGYSQQPVLIIQQGHRSRILFDDINKKEAAWLTVDQKEAFLWNIPTGRQLKRISIPTTIRGAALVNDGEEIAIAAYDFSTDSRLHFFNARTAEKTGDIEIADNSYAPLNRRKNWKPIDQLIRNRDGSRLILRSFDKLYIIDARKRNLIGENRLSSYDNQTGLLSNDQLIVAGADAGKLILLKSNLAGNEIKRVTIEKNSKPVCLEVHPDLPLVALGFKDGSILIIDEELQVKKEITQGTELAAGSSITDLSFNSTGNSLLINTGLSIYQYELNTNEIKRFESRFASGSQRVAYSPSNENAILISSESIPYQLEWSTGKKLREYYVNSPGIGEFFFNTKEDRMLSGPMELNFATGSSRKYVEFDSDERILLPISDSVVLCSFKKMEYIKEEWVNQFGVRGRNTRTGKIEFSVKLPFKYTARYGAVSLDKKTIAVCDDLEGDLFLLSGDRYNKITKVRVQKGRAVRGLAFSPDGKTLFAGSANYSDTLRRFDIERNSWSNISKVKNPNFTNSLPVTKDSRYLLFTIDNFNSNVSEDLHQFAIYDLKENRVSLKFKVEQMISRIALSPNNDLFAVGFFDGHVDVFRWNDSLPFYSYRPHNNVIQQIEFSKTRNWIISRADDGLLSIWDYKEKDKVIDLFNVYSADRAYAMVMSGNYYMMPPGVIREIHFAKGFQTYSVSQFDLVLNRPDKVLERIGMADASLKEMYKKAIARRMQKNGLDGDAVLKVDELQPLLIEGRNSVPSNTSSPVLPLKVNTSNKEVREFLLYINNQLVEKARPSASNAAEFIVALNEGVNNIELAYLTKKGIESLHERIEIKFESPTPIVSKRYYIGIGVSDYADTERNLRYAAKDVQDIQEKFKKLDSSTVVNLYLDKQATKQQLLQIRELLAKTTIHDQVIISFSGHGVLDTAYNFYFATHDMNFKDPAGKGFSYSDIESLFENIPARKKLILIDACQSGSVEKELFSGEGSDKEGNDSVKTYSRGGIVSGNQKKSELSSSIKLMQQYFADISKGKGAVVISASAGEENALESAEWKNGVFSFCFIQSVFEGKGDTNRDGHVSVSEVKEYMEKEVLRLTNGRQRPASRKENLEWDWWIR